MRSLQDIETARFVQSVENEKIGYGVDARIEEL